jgi:uncharacterized protein (DUF427 family)
MPFTAQPEVLFETGLPPRYYISPEDVLVKSKTTRCPYKGVASYWSVEVGGDRVEDLTWSYQDPIPEAARIKGLLAFLTRRWTSRWTARYRRGPERNGRRGRRAL